jgi:ABC-type dipeptide/oligopeptide/nickel transport system permease subunit
MASIQKGDMPVAQDGTQDSAAAVPPPSTVGRTLVDTKEGTATGAATLATLSATPVPRQRSLWTDAWRRLARNKGAVVGLVIVVVFIVVASLAPLFAPYGEAEVVDVRLANHGPSWLWPFGLDQNGRDVWSRVLYGARVSLLVGVVSQLIVLAIGVPIGAVAGYFAGSVDNLMMRFVDVFYAVPQLLLVMIFLNLFGPGLWNIFLGIGLVSWVTIARLVRGQFLSLREAEYVNAARVSGAGSNYIMFRHLLPNSLTPIIVAITFGIPTAIFTEAALSFVGVGINPPQASWGQMVGVGTDMGLVQAAPHILLFPVAAIGLTMLGFTFLGDGLRDALDVRSKD